MFLFSFSTFFRTNDIFHFHLLSAYVVELENDHGSSGRKEDSEAVDHHAIQTVDFLAKYFSLARFLSGFTGNNNKKDIRRPASPTWEPWNWKFSFCKNLTGRNWWGKPFAFRCFSFDTLKAEEKYRLVSLCYAIPIWRN